MKTKCGTRYLNAALWYGQLYQYNCGRGVEEMKITSCYLSSKLLTLESSSGSVTNVNCPLSSFSSSVSYGKRLAVECFHVIVYCRQYLSLFLSFSHLLWLYSWYVHAASAAKLSLEDNTQGEQRLIKFRWALLCGLQMALVVFSCTNLYFPHTLHLQIQLVRVKEPGATGVWLPI